MFYLIGRTQDGEIGIACKLRSILISAGAAAAVVAIRPHGLTAYSHDITFEIPLLTTVQFNFAGIPFTNGLSVDVDANVLTYIVEYEPA